MPCWLPCICKEMVNDAAKASHEARLADSTLTLAGQVLRHASWNAYTRLAGHFDAFSKYDCLLSAVWQMRYLLDELMEGIGKGLANQQVGLSFIVVRDHARTTVCAVGEATRFGQGTRRGLPSCICGHQISHAQHCLLQASALLIIVSLLHTTC